MSDLFIPEKFGNLEDYLTPKVKHDDGDEGIVFAFEGNIYYMDDWSEVPLTTKLNGVQDMEDLCFHKGALYGTDSGGHIWDTQTGEHIFSEFTTVYNLCSHKGKLYGDPGCWVTDVESMDVIKKFDIDLGALCSGKNGLYVGGFEALGIIEDSGLVKPIMSFTDYKVNGVCVSDDLLFLSIGHNKTEDPHSMIHCYTGANQWSLGRRTNWTMKMFTFKGRPYDSVMGLNLVYDSLDDRVVFDSKLERNIGLDAICVVPKWFGEEII